MRTYAAQIVDGYVEQVIVGDAAWAIEYLGGDWIDLPSKEIPPELIRPIEPSEPSEPSELPSE